MKKIIPLLFCCFAAVASANDGVQFQISAVKGSEWTKNFGLFATPGHDAKFANIVSSEVVNEVNSNLGEIQNISTKLESGISGKVSYARNSKANANDIEAVVEYEVIDKGIVLSKGTHHINGKPGDVIKLPAANGIELTVTLKPA